MYSLLLQQRGLLLLDELALLVVALGREQRPALAPRPRDLSRIATKLGSRETSLCLWCSQ